MIKSSLVPCRPCCQDVKALTGHPPVLSASGARGTLDIGGGGRGGAIIRPISAVPPKFMSVIRAHSSKLPVNRPFSMKRLLFVILRCFDWSSPWRRNTGFWARPTARGARAEQAPWGILGDSIAVISWETTTQTPWRSFTSKDGPQPPAQH